MTIHYTLVRTKLGKQLRTDEGFIAFPEMEFVDVAEAERWLEINNLRGIISREAR